MEKVTEQLVGSLVMDLDHATPDLWVHASKRPRDEEEDICLIERSSVKRRRIEDAEVTDILPSERTGQENDPEEKEENEAASNSTVIAARPPVLTMAQPGVCKARRNGHRNHPGSRPNQSA